MFSFRFLLALFLIIPIVEIYLLIKVGGVIGAIPTVFLVVFTAVLGAMLLRVQGFSTLRRVQASMARGEIPAIELLEGAVLLVGGALLLTPGFFTDAIGFACLVPSLRRAAIMWAIRRGIVVAAGGHPGGPGGRHGEQSAGQRHHQPRTLEGEFWEDEDKKR